MKHLAWVSWVTLALTAGLVGLLSYWSIFPLKVIDIADKDAVMVDKAVYYPGDHIAYTLEICKYYNVPGVVSRALVNSVRANYTEYRTNILPGCRTVTIKDMKIPLFVDPGVYHIETTITYELNPIRELVYVWKSVEFEVQ